MFATTWRKAIQAKGLTEENFDFGRLGGISYRLGDRERIVVDVVKA